MALRKARHRYLTVGWLVALLLASAVVGQERCANFTQPKFMSALPGSAIGEQSVLAPAQQVTVVLLNWLRQDNVRLIVETLENYTAVSEVLVLMCNPETRFSISTSKAKALDFSALETAWGLTGRFKACLLARNPWVLVMDDDLLVTEAGLDRLLQAKSMAADRLVGFFARCATAADDPHHALKLTTSHGVADSVQQRSCMNKSSYSVLGCSAADGHSFLGGGNFKSRLLPTSECALLEPCGPLPGLSTCYLKGLT